MSNTYPTKEEKFKIVKNECSVNKKKGFKKTREDKYYICYCFEKPLHICKPCYEDCHLKFCKDKRKTIKEEEKTYLNNFETSLKTKCKEDMKAFINHCECQTKKSHDFTERHETLYRKFTENPNLKTIFTTLNPFEAQLTEYTKYEYVDYNEDGEEYFETEKEKKEAYEFLFENHFISMLAASYLNRVENKEDVTKNKSLTTFLTKSLKNNTNYFFFNINEKFKKLEFFQEKQVDSNNNDNSKDITESDLGNELFLYRKLYIIPNLMKKNKIFTAIFGYDENISFLHRRLLFQSSSDNFDDQVFNYVKEITKRLLEHFIKMKNEHKQEKSNDKNLIMIVKELCKYIEIFMNFELSDEEKKQKKFTKESLKSLLDDLLSIKKQGKFNKDFYRLDQAIYMIQTKLIDFEISKNKLNDRKAFYINENDLISRENLPKNLGKNKKFLELSKYEKVFYKLKYFEEFYTNPLKHFVFPDHINMQINKGDDDEELKIDNFVQEIFNISKWHNDKSENSGKNSENLDENIKNLEKNIKTTFSPKNIIEKICEHIKRIEKTLQEKNEVEKKQIQYQFFSKGYTTQILGLYQFVTSNRYFVKCFEETKEFIHNDEGEIYNSFNFFISVNLKLLYLLIENNEVLIPLFFNTKTLNLIFTQRRELSEEEILEKKEKKELKESLIRKYEDEMNINKEGDNEEIIISDDAKKKEKEQIDLEVYKKNRFNNNEVESNEHDNNIKKNKEDETKNKENREKIKNLERQKILPPEIFNALDFNNIITFYAEILKQLKKYEIKIDLTPLFKKLQQVSKINTEENKIYGDRENNNQNFIKINDTNIFCNILATDNKEKQKKVFKFSLKLNSSVLKILNLSYKVNSTLYKELSEHYVLSICCKVVDELNYYIFRSVRDNDIVLERTEEKVKELFSKLKDIYKDLPLQYRRLFKISENFSSLHFLILSRMINGDFLTEQINLYTKNKMKKRLNSYEIQNKFLDNSSHKNEVQQFISNIIDFETELEISYSKNFIKYYFKNLYTIRDSKALEESIQTSSKDFELDYMQIKILEEEERQKMIYFDGDYVPKKKIDKKVDFYILRELRNFLLLNKEKDENQLKFILRRNNDGNKDSLKIINIEEDNLLKILVSYYRDAIAYPMFQVIYNIVLTNIVEDNLKNTFSILYCFLKSLHHFLNLVHDIIKGNATENNLELLDNLFISKNLERYLDKNFPEGKEADSSAEEMKLYIENKNKLVEEREKMDMYTQLYHFIKDPSRKNQDIFSAKKIETERKQESDVKQNIHMYEIIIEHLRDKIEEELKENFNISKISETVKIKEDNEKNKERKFRDGENGKKNENENKNKNDNFKVYQLDDIFKTLFDFIYLFDFGFNNYDVDNDNNNDDEDKNEHNDENSSKDEKNKKIDKELKFEIFSLKNSFSTRREIEKSEDDDEKEKKNRLDKFFKDFSENEEEDSHNTGENQEGNSSGNDDKKMTELVNSNEFKQDLFEFNISQDLEESDKPSFYNNIDLILHLYHESPAVLQTSIIKYLPQKEKLNFFTFNYNNEIANISYLIYLDLINFDFKEINDRHKDYFLKIVEFYRLLCEDHNANIQSILTDPIQNEIMDEFTKKQKEDKKEEKKRRKLKKKNLTSASQNNNDQNSDLNDSEDDSDEEDNYKLDEDGNRIENKYTEFSYLYNDKKEIYVFNNFEIKVKNPHTVGYNIVEVLVNLWININETICYYKEKENFLKYIRVLNYKKIEEIIDKISEFLIEIIQGSYQENLEKISFEEGQPLNRLLKTIFKIIEIITRNIPDSIEDDEQLKKNELSKLRKIMEFTLKKFMKFVIAYIEENENPDAKKSSVIKDLRPASIYSLIRYCVVKIYLKYGDEDHKNELEKYIHAKELEKLYKTNVDVGNDDLFELGSLAFQFMKISGSLSIKESQKFKRFINRLREETEDLKEKENMEHGFFPDGLKKEQFDQEKKKISLEKLNIQIYIFFEKIIQYIEISYVAARHHELLEALNQYPNKKFLAKIHQKKMEENKDKSLQKVFFIGNYLTMFMNKQDTLKFIEDAPFLNFNQRLDYIFRKVNNYLDLINTRYYLCRNMSFIYEIHLIDYKNIIKLSVIISILTNIILFFSLRVDNMWNYRLINVVNFLGLFHVYILFLAILIWLAVNILIIKLKYSSIGNKYSSYKKLSSFEQIRKQVKNIIKLFGDRDLTAIFLNFIFGFIAVNDPQLSFFYALQLVAIFALYPTMMSVIIAIKMRYEQFLSSALLILILILFFSSVSFLYFRELYFSPDLNENVCDSFSHCFLTMLNNGIRSGNIGDFGNIKSIDDPLYWYYFIFSWIFYFIVILIMLNIINGIIIDTFQDLREQEEERDDCKENMCYVCSNRRSRFEMCGLNYEEHISEEHSIKEYLFYLIKNYLVNEHDLNAVDSYVLELTKNKRLDFFPIKTSINLEKLLDS